MYQEFLEHLGAEKPYIGFFAAEEKYISRVNEDYLKVRRQLFLGINQCKEDPFEFIEPFIQFQGHRLDSQTSELGILTAGSLTYVMG